MRTYPLKRRQRLLSAPRQLPLFGRKDLPIMPTKSRFFPSKYLKAEDIRRPIEVTISAIAEETMGDGEKKAVCHFEELPKGLVINITNWDMLEHITGCPDCDDWGGTKVLLDTELTRYKGSPTKGLRVHPIRKEKSAAQKKAEIADELDDELPGDWGEGEPDAVDDLPDNKTAGKKKAA
jgi:hypothetical protein